MAVSEEDVKNVEETTTMTVVENTDLPSDFDGATITTIPREEVFGSLTAEVKKEETILERELWFVNLDYDIRQKIGFGDTAPADNFVVINGDFII